jgi:UDP-N-acetylmuramyl tripeptide synthase
MALGGVARHNIANALAACAVAVLLDFPMDAIRQGLADFTCSPEDNPGRLNCFDLGGAQVIVDSAHNQHGFEALLTMANELPAKRRLIVLGQTGDRSADDSRTLAHAIWRYRPDRVIVKELEERQEGRGLGRVPARIARVLRRIGAGRSAVATAPSELAAARKALTWARRGDLIILTQQQGQEVLRYVQGLEKDGWRPRKPLPAVED